MMTMPNKLLLMPVLGYLGVIPFAATALLMWEGENVIAVDPSLLFVAYSAVILAFLGGTLWGRGRVLDDAPSTSVMLLASNIVALMAWGSVIFFDSYLAAAVAVLILGYVCVLNIERRYAIALASDSADQYLALRIKLTSVVLVLHVLVLIKEL